jgi:hypothetical protein
MPHDRRHRDASALDSFFAIKQTNPEGFQATMNTTQATQFQPIKT